MTTLKQRQTKNYQKCTVVGCNIKVLAAECPTCQERSALLETEGDAGTLEILGNWYATHYMKNHAPSLKIRLMNS